MQARISLIWAQDEKGLIGTAKGLPWHLPADMQWFRRQTMGKPVLMGRKTHASIGRPLPARKNIILTRRHVAVEGCTVVHSLDEAVRAADDAPELMVIGGAEVYALTLPHADRLYITEIHASFEGDVYFPRFNSSAWREAFREDHTAAANNPCDYSFVILER